MTTAWETLDEARTDAGTLKLLRRGEKDFLIQLDGRVLMNSHASRSERILAELACRPIAGRRAPRVLIGGLGMGCTLRAALDVLPRDAVVRVAELHPVVEAWCRGPLTSVSDAALDDPRVEVVIGDVAAGGHHPDAQIVHPVLQPFWFTRLGVLRFSLQPVFFHFATKICTSLFSKDFYIREPKGVH